MSPVNSLSPFSPSKLTYINVSVKTAIMNKTITKNGYVMVTGDCHFKIKTRRKSIVKMLLPYVQAVKMGAIHKNSRFFSPNSTSVHCTHMGAGSATS